MSTQTAGTTRYLLDGLSVIAQYAPGGERQAWYTQSLARIDEVLNVANESGKFWYQADALGSVYGLTNQAGALIGSQGYDVFGAPTPAPSGPAGQPYGFTGREHELDSGLVYARARYLNPGVGRWDRADPLVLAIPPEARASLAETSIGVGLDLHLYAYVNGLPTRARDPSGLIPAGAVVLAMMPLGLQWDSVVIGLTQYALGRAEDAALIQPTNGADCDGCMIAISQARRIIWTGWNKAGDALLRVRMPQYLLFYAIGEMVGADDVLKLAGHRQKIEDEQTQLKEYAAAIMTVCKSPQLRDLGWWYLYIAMLRMP